MSEQLTIQISSGSDIQLRLEFSKSSDRWSHRWLLLAGGAETEIMTSVEGSPEEEWPPSPPLQDVSKHELPNGNAILGVGMAGKSHWSASMAGVELADGQDREIIRCELACLQKGKNESDSNQPNLRSFYKLASEFTVDGVNENHIQLVCPNNEIKIAVETINGAQWGSQFEINESHLSIQPSVFSDSPVRSTQWGFQASIVG